MGLIAANNYMNDSLVSMNLGITAPNVLADPRFIFSWNNLISTARTLAMMWAPAHTSGIQLAFMLPGFLMSSAGLYQKTKGFTRIFDLLTLRTERVNKPCFLAPALQPDWLAQSTYI